MSATSPRPVAMPPRTRKDWWTPRAAVRIVVSLPARALLCLIWLYRKTLSPALPVVFGPACGCRFYPTCAVYAAQAVRERGALRGAWLALCRLLKCHPLHPGGFDPVPPPRRPVARRVSVWTRTRSSPTVSPSPRELGCSR
jgi:putative membrane protein insertion efficiency factor